MSRHKWDPCCLRPPGLVVPVRIDRSGELGPTRGQAAGPGFRQTSPGFYVPAEVDAAVVEQRILEQANRLRTHGAVTGWAALRWRGAAFFDGTTEGGRRQLPVPLVVGRSRLRPDPRIFVSEAQIAPTERTKIGGVWCATVQRALFDAMRWAGGVRTASVFMDMAAAARLISVTLMTRYVVQRQAWTGVPLVRDALAISSDHSRSPQETRMRHVWVLDAGLAPPLCNVPVFSLDGRLLGYPDILDVEAGCVGEYDGADHKARRRHQRDVAREQVFREHGLEYFTVVEGDLADRAKVVARMHSARSRSLFAAPHERRWTLEPPPWWTPRESLDTWLLRINEAPMLVRT
jgi:hypothetical protein